MLEDVGLWVNDATGLDAGWAIGNRLPNLFHFFIFYYFFFFFCPAGKRVSCGYCTRGPVRFTILISTTMVGFIVVQADISAVSDVSMHKTSKFQISSINI